ncbi:MAG: T9SS type A sorting domain-containing protein [candidate division WOR-3 bacterium]
MYVMMLTMIILSQVVQWEILSPYQGFGPGNRNIMILQDGILIFGGNRRDPLGDTCWGFCTGVDTASGITLWEHEFTNYEKSIMFTFAKGKGEFFSIGQCYTSSNNDILVAKLDESGNLLWERRTGNPLYDGAVTSAFVDTGGNLVVVGCEYEENTDIYILSWDSDGNLRWSFSYDSPWHKDDFSFSAGMDEEGSTYAVGYYTGPIKGKWTVAPMIFELSENGKPGITSGPADTCYGLTPLVIKVDSSGNLIWVDDCEYWNVGGELMFAEYSFGRLYASGFACNGDLYSQCEDKQGFHFWHAWENQNFLTMEPHGGFVDMHGNLYLTGHKCNPGPDAFFVSYTFYGERRVFREVFPGYGTRIVGDSLGNLFIGGRVIDSIGKDFAVAKLDTLGNLIWLYRKDDGTPDTNQPDQCLGLLPDNRGGVFATGMLYDSVMTPIHYVVHLADTTSGVKENKNPKPGLTIIPAPSGFYITGPSGEARIYDSAGRLVMAREIKGKTLISPLVPGVYFVVAGKERVKVAVR